MFTGYNLKLNEDFFDNELMSHRLHFQSRKWCVIRSIGSENDSGSLVECPTDGELLPGRKASQIACGTVSASR